MTGGFLLLLDDPSLELLFALVYPLQFGELALCELLLFVQFEEVV